MSEQDERRERAGHQADEQVAGDVAADGARDSAARPRKRACAVGGSTSRNASNQAAAPERDEERQERHGDDSGTGRDDAANDADRRSAAADDVGFVVVADSLTCALHDVEAVLEESQLPLPVRELLHQAGCVLNKMRGLADERRYEQPGEDGDGQYREAECDGDSRPTTKPASLEELDQWLERHCEDDGDDELGEDAADGLGENEQEYAAERECRKCHERSGSDRDLALRRRRHAETLPSRAAGRVREFTESLRDRRHLVHACAGACAGGAGGFARATPPSCDQ